MFRSTEKENEYGNPENIDIFSEDEPEPYNKLTTQNELEELSANMLKPSAHLSLIRKINVDTPYAENFHKESYKQLLNNIAAKLRDDNAEFFGKQKRYFDQKIEKIQNQIEKEFQNNMRFLESEQGKSKFF